MFTRVAGLGAANGAAVVRVKATPAKSRRLGP
ncbi:hypothetical protein BOTU111922_20065 [Bordetella tumulicola]